MGSHLDPDIARHRNRRRASESPTDPSTHGFSGRRPLVVNRIEDNQLDSRWDFDARTFALKIRNPANDASSRSASSPLRPSSGATPPRSPPGVVPGREPRTNHGAIIEACKGSRDADYYDEVGHISGRPRKHDALTNQMVWLAETTEALYGTNDFHPYVRSELRELDPEGAALVQKLWREPIPGR